MIALGCLVAMLIQYQTGKFEELEHKFRKTRDDGTELNLLLKEKNQNLLEKQDYEIYTATLRERNRIARRFMIMLSAICCPGHYYGGSHEGHQQGREPKRAAAPAGGYLEFRDEQRPAEASMTFTTSRSI